MLLLLVFEVEDVTEVLDDARVLLVDEARVLLVEDDARVLLVLEATLVVVCEARQCQEDLLVRLTNLQALIVPYKSISKPSTVYLENTHNRFGKRS